MPFNFYRFSKELSITASLTTTPEIDVRGAKEVMIYVLVGSAAVTFTFHATWEPGAAYHAAEAVVMEPIGDAITETVIAITVAAEGCYNLPKELLGAGIIKIVGNATATIRISAHE